MGKCFKFGISYLLIFSLVIFPSVPSYGQVKTGDFEPPEVSMETPTKPVGEIEEERELEKLHEIKTSTAGYY